MNKFLILLSILLLQACEQAPTAVVQREEVKLLVTASGEIESKQTALIAPPSVAHMWQYQIKQLTPENSRVKKGQLLVSFDDKTVSEGLVDKKGDLDRAQKEFDNKKIKETEKEQELILALAEKSMEHDKAKRKGEIFDNSRSENDRKKAEIDFTIATNDLFLAQEKLNFHLSNYKLNLKRAQGKIDRLTAEVNGFLRDIEKLKVKAPIDGMVIYKANWQGEKPAEGENIQFGQPVIELAVIEQLQLKAQIAEPDSGKIKLGQSVKITLDGTQELVFQGEIVSLGRVFRDKSHQDKRRIFDVIIAFENTNSSFIRPGMTARIEVTTKVFENVLTLPTTAIKNLKQNTTVDLVGLFGQERIQIDIAEVLNNKVVISNGIQEGDVVAL